MNGKALFASKTFWTNILMGVLAYTGTVPVTKTTALIGFGVNVALRLLTGVPITSLIPGDK